MTASRRTYVVSVYSADSSVIVEAVQRDERIRLDDLDGLAEQIRAWERESASDDAEVEPLGA